MCRPAIACYTFLGLLGAWNLFFTKAADVESARCRVRCLAHLKHKLGGPGELGFITFEKCFQDAACTACLRPCGFTFSGLGGCMEVCQLDEEDCEQSCNFLKHLETVRPGSCPSPEEAKGFAATCLDTCKDDPDCEADLKCCKNGCGTTCQKPKHVHMGVPGVPEMPSLRERGKLGVIELKWKAVETNTSVPILYMVQERYSIGKHSQSTQLTNWVQVAQTTQTSSVMRDVGTGRWYQWRVASVAINGTRGFSPPSKPYKLNEEPTAPSMPQNLTEGQTVIKENKVYLTVEWQHPKKYDLPITRYKVFWSKRLKGVSAALVHLQEHRKVLPGNQLKYEIENLEPDTTYFVQVQAICAYGEARLKSERASMFVLTYPIEQGTQNEQPTALVNVMPLLTLPALKDIKASGVYFHNGQLKANISWTPPEDFDDHMEEKVLLYWTAVVCIADNNDAGELAKTISATTHARFFILYDLKFDCRYTVKVQLVDGRVQGGPMSTMTLQTPSCGAVEVIGDIKPDCPTHVPRVPNEPADLSHSFLIMQTNITARISWQHPASDVPIIGYRIIWGQAAIAEADDHSIGQMETETSLTKVISKDATSFSIGNLREATGYIVHLQAMSQAGSGKVSTIQFTTPVLQPQPLAPPYKTEFEVQLDVSDKRKISSTETPAISVETWAPNINKIQEPHTWSHGSRMSQSHCSIFVTIMFSSSSWLLFR